MTIKEVEELLEVPRATVRFYEKKGLLVPKRGDNSYREYDEDDIAILKKVIVLRKIGLSVSDIEDFINRDVELQDLLEENVVKLQEQMKELEGALRISQKMQDNKEDADSFDEEFYWEEIHAEEQAGNKFLEIVNDVAEFEKKMILKQFDLINSEGQMIYSKKESFFRAFGLCIVMGVVFCVMDGWQWKNFAEGFLWPFSCIIVMSILGLPVHFLGKKHSKAAQVIKKIGLSMAGVFMVVLVILAVVLEK